MELTVAARSDVGMIRSGNEDAFFAHATRERGVFIVADGMGGHAAGEVASEMAVQIVSRELHELNDVYGEAARLRVAESLRIANRAIYDRTIQESDKQGMGTTASVLVMSGARYLIGQVGDSRVYLLRDGALRQLTKDHSYVQEQVDAGFLTPEQARYHPYSNVITRCVGASDVVEPDTYSGELKVGDVFLVASDGLTGMVDDRRRQQLLHSRASPRRGVHALMAEANYRGGSGNSRRTVESARLLRAGEPEIRRRLVAGEVTEGHAGAQAGIEAGKSRLDAWREVVRRKLSVRDTEVFVRKAVAAAEPAAGQPAGTAGRTARRDAMYADIEGRLRRALSTRVSVTPQRQGARITIDCYSGEEFEGVIARILGEEDDER